jgi:hypothetical protein
LSPMSSVWTFRNQNGFLFIEKRRYSVSKPFHVLPDP